MSDAAYLLRDRTRRALFLFALLILALQAIGFVRDLPAVIPEPQLADFAVYYIAAAVLNQGQPELLYNTELKIPAAEQAHIETVAGVYLYLPMLAVVLRPLARLPYPAAVLVWIALSLILLAASVVLLLRLARLNAPWWVTLLVFVACLILPPTSSTLLLGQVNIILLFLFVAGFWRIDQDPHSPLGGFLLGIAAAIKLFPILFVVPLAWRREWRSIAGMLGGVFAALLIGVLGAGGLTNTVIYLTQVLPGITQGSHPIVQSLWGVVRRLLEPSAITYPVFSADNYVTIEGYPLINAPALAYPLAAALALGVVAATGWFILQSARRHSPTGFDLSTVLTGSLLVLPLVWDHYTIWLVIPWAYWLALAPTRRTAFVILLATAFLTVHRYWKPLLFYGVPLWSAFFGFLAILITWAYCGFLAAGDLKPRTSAGVPDPTSTVSVIAP